MSIALRRPISFTIVALTRRKRYSRCTALRIANGSVGSCRKREHLTVVITTTPMTEFVKRLRNALVAAALVASAIACNARYPMAPDPTLSAVRIHVLSAVSELIPNSTATFVAYAIDSDGVYRDVTTEAQWSSSDSNVLTAGTFLNNRAVVRGVGRGDANLMVSYGGETDAVTLRVVTPPLPIPRVALTIIGGLYAMAASSPTITVQIETRTVFQTVTTEATITSSDPSIATIDGNRIRPVSPGTIRLTASYNGLVGTTLISVNPAPSVQKP
jgi:hypothetical protein